MTVKLNKVIACIILCFSIKQTKVLYIKLQHIYLFFFSLLSYYVGFIKLPIPHIKVNKNSTFMATMCAFRIYTKSKFTFY